MLSVKFGENQYCIYSPNPDKAQTVDHALRMRGYSHVVTIDDGITEGWIEGDHGFAAYLDHGNDNRTLLFMANSKEVVALVVEALAVTEPNRKLLTLTVEAPE